MGGLLADTRALNSIWSSKIENSQMDKERSPTSIQPKTTACFYSTVYIFWVWQLMDGCMVCVCVDDFYGIYSIDHPLTVRTDLEWVRCAVDRYELHCTCQTYLIETFFVSIFFSVFLFDLFPSINVCVCDQAGPIFTCEMVGEKERVRVGWTHSIIMACSSLSLFYFFSLSMFVPSDLFSPPNFASLSCFNWSSLSVCMCRLSSEWEREKIRFGHIICFYHLSSGTLVSP